MAQAERARTADGDRALAGSASADRKIARSADLTVSVEDPDAAAAQVERLVGEAGGYVASSRRVKDSEFVYDCRLPAARLDGALNAVAALGSEQSRSVSALDVTEEYADLESRLRNGRALRDRLQELAKRASNVAEVLSVEKELGRVQADVESMEGRLERMKSSVELSVLSVKLQGKRILGPIGLLVYAVDLALEKLFFIR